MEKETPIKGGRGRRSKIYLTIFIVLAVLIGGFLWWWSRKEAREIARVTEMITEVTKPKKEQIAEGVFSQSMLEKTVLINNKDKYDLNLLGKWKDASFGYQEKTHSLVIETEIYFCSIRTYQAKDKTLINWIKQWIQRGEYPYGPTECLTNPQELKIRSYQVFKVINTCPSLVSPFYYYFLKSKNLVYMFMSDNPENIEEIINSFSPII